MFEWFVAKRFLFKNHMILPKGSAKIGVIAVAIGLAVMIIAMATARGLQYEVKKKLESFQARSNWPPMIQAKPLIVVIPQCSTPLKGGFAAIRFQNV